ncbi:MAG: 30S ribosome-binding factor RbfA [Chloroflexi bacterium]|nr:MAG: 30S ribosome-binding factor RbfA [Chloroflexota bacterium]
MGHRCTGAILNARPTFAGSKKVASKFFGTVSSPRVQAAIRWYWPDLRPNPSRSRPEVKLSPDLRNATVKVSVLGETDEREAAIDGLEHAKGFIRRELGLRLSNLRFAPDLRFQLDEGVSYSVRVSQLLREAQQEEHNARS